MGSYRGHRLALVVLLTGMVLLGAAPVAGAAAVPASVTVRDGGAQGAFHVLAVGFGPEEALSVWLTGPHQQVLAAQDRVAGDDGAVAFQLRLPRHLQPGGWAITVHGLTSDREAVGRLETPPVGPDVPLTVSPPHGPAYTTTFVVVGSGFAPGETVSLWLSEVGGTMVIAGSTVVAGGTVVAGRDGRVTVTFTANGDGMSGPWLLSAYGQASDHLGVAPLTITGSP